MIPGLIFKSLMCFFEVELCFFLGFIEVSLTDNIVQL